MEKNTVYCPNVKLYAQAQLKGMGLQGFAPIQPKRALVRSHTDVYSKGF